MWDVMKRFKVALAKTQIGNRVALASAMLVTLGLIEAPPCLTAGGRDQDSGAGGVEGPGDGASVAYKVACLEL
jgi:hypothetical protein